MSKRYCTRSVTAADLCIQRVRNSLTFLLVLRDIRTVGSLLQKANSLAIAWTLLNQVSFDLHESRQASADGRGWISQAVVFASTRALKLLFNRYRTTVCADTTTIRIRSESVRDLRIKICVAIRGRFACDGDGLPLFAYRSEAFVLLPGCLV